MIKTSILKQVGISTDICEDWDLTLDLYLREYDSGISGTNILFDETLNADNEAPVSFGAYIRQRLRVSEGHTRGFLKKIPTLILQKQPFKNKIEIFFTGARYLRYLFILSVLLLDCVIFSQAVPTLNVCEMVAFAVQILCIAIFVLSKVLGLVICRRRMHYTFAFLISELIVEICVSPALIAGSLLGILRKKGSFYRTQRIGGATKGI